MENLKIDTKGLRGGPIEWTKDQPLPHAICTTASTNGTGDKIARVQDWKTYDVK